jgi:uncharacterized protein YjbI with pentapeptide repeats
MNKEKNGESEPQKELVEKPKLNEEQYKLLLSCSEKKNVSDWNKYREEHPDDEISLQGANLREAHLQGADLSEAHLYDADLSEAHLQGANLRKAHLQIAKLTKAELQGAWLTGAKLQAADLSEAHLQGANLTFAELPGAILTFAELQGAQLWQANLQAARLWEANLQDAKLREANLQAAMLWEANLQGAKLREANLQGADFTMAVVDGQTLIWECEVNRWYKNELFTDFEGVGLDSMRIDPEIKQLLEYNIRRKNWGEWYKGKPENNWMWTMMRLLVTSPIRLFFSISDYGFSTVRIILWFFLFSLAFTSIYYIWGKIASQGIVDNLFIDNNCVAVESWIVPLRALYFSIVTMTTLGFGDMCANAHSACSHILISLQVIIGYFILGALVTRFAVLFTAGGPAGKFAKMNDEKAR